MSEAAEEMTRAQLRHGLRLATLLIVLGTVGGQGVPSILRHLGGYPVPLAQLAALAVLAAVLAGEAVLLLRRRTWGRLRQVAVAAVLAASVLSYVTLPEGRTSTSVDWIFGAANWVGLVVLLDRPLRAAVAFLVAHDLTALVHLVTVDPNRGDLARFATGSVTVIGLPLCVAVVAAVFNSLSAAAAASRAEIERVRISEAIAAESHRRRQQRLAELSATTVPLLEGLADGSLRPEDPAIQRRCAIEAGRMRRLFAETDTVANPLLHELRHCADVADRKGVVVELDARGQWPTPPVAVRRDLTEPVLSVLAGAASRARIAVVGGTDLVSVSVVADSGEVDVPEPVTPGVHVETVTNDDTVWMEVRWQPTPQPTPQATRKPAALPVS
ncbi:hypothetical protein E1295_38780 [Nonomuraea mesophila]|uniref:Uncharacterized protein n=1 Tax=Nonomuraea mesophila TaxID=2530382 RepID=A0A4R5EFG9_9ACTN|nr:hypothetical protein [Nonomuraea mesophila]TDE32983.1 hypothetical protein E1295_38780 [Nonomuraea mesophila]